MVEDKIKEAITFFEERLRKNGLNIHRIILFGSQVEGRANNESDIDLVVVSEDFSGKDIFERVKLLNGADADTISQFMIPIDVIMMSPEDLESETSILAAYARRGKIMFPQN